MSNPKKVSVEVGDELFRFTCFEQWVSKASSWFRNSGLRNGSGYVCLDTKGRICQIGSHFMRAQADASYPIVVYEVPE